MDTCIEANETPLEQQWKERDIMRRERRRNRGKNAGSANANKAG